MSTPFGGAGDDIKGTASVSHYNAATASYTRVLDIITPFPGPRWAFTIFMVVLFMVRIIVAEGWYIVCYALGIYLLNLFLAFLTPKFDPALTDRLEDEAEAEGPGLLPVKNDEEFKPFIRRLPEFKFWLNSTWAITISLFCTFFTAFDIPVFWPILLFYWVFLFVLTMRRQIEHMIRHKYVPFSNWGKKRYGAK
ncbi:hypothetical protein H4219_001630 [Mycoemilia scoparia]|uniref:Protein RER1 n=1 Tax=Mycoemilia scoparia TaxID=417184 RepID=A0A9W7ZZL8_9FUNG|nr:hypothetical protein H4219_001630 [Mycoemilia scoparia]